MMFTRMLCAILLTAQISAVNANLSLTVWHHVWSVNRMADRIITQRTFQYRIYPSPAQKTKLEQTLGFCCELYNAALQERRDAWRINRTSINYHAQAIQLPEIKSIRE